MSEKADSTTPNKPAAETVPAISALPPLITVTECTRHVGGSHVGKSPLRSAREAPLQSPVNTTPTTESHRMSPNRIDAEGRSHFRVSHCTVNAIIIAYDAKKRRFRAAPDNPVSWRFRHVADQLADPRGQCRLRCGQLLARRATARLVQPAVTQQVRGLENHFGVTRRTRAAPA